MRSSNLATSVAFFSTMVSARHPCFLAEAALTNIFVLNATTKCSGRLSYIRTAQCIDYFFYKNIVFTLPQFIFGAVSAYSGQVCGALLCICLEFSVASPET